MQRGGRSRQGPSSRYPYRLPSNLAPPPRITRPRDLNVTTPAGWQLFDAAVNWAAPAPTITYVRDVADRIIERRVNGAVDTRYAYTATADTPALTINASGVVIEKTVALPGGVLLTTRTTGNIWSYPNIHGDIVATCDNTGTKQGATRGYDPYGNTLGATTLPDNSAGNLDNGWHGTQQRPTEHQPSLSTVTEMGARQYTPLLGRFIETDPIEGGTPNDYTYPNDPVNSSDLSGLAESCKRHRTLCDQYARILKLQYPALAVYWMFNAKALSVLRLLVRSGAVNRGGMSWGSDGCSSLGWVADMAVAGRFGDACGRHDFVYRNHRAIFGRTDEGDRKTVDIQLWSDAIRRCTTGDWWCNGITDSIYTGVRLGPFGYNAYRSR